ncbi:GAF domain-containing protein [Rhodococcus oxybenzonivorans]|uniref:helix-turn-helix domain-containing protein n=1 Tax=Rhodococcus TaxID=1827 RepID=UPI00131F5084|nr:MULTISPECIES: GAF domain-containing protein [Rhodococcus]MDV7357570.1 GAF domain-containing protein [Rhodococcus oxybenzonivorans]QHE72450.1 transcriptional regulator, CdaR [Rhodococcus sp. WAY2]
MKHELRLTSSENLAGGTATDILRVASELVRAVSRTGSDLGEVERTVVEILSAASELPVSAEEPGFHPALLALLREVAGQHEARDDRYRALLDTVADITSEDDPDRLLGGIADRARRLLRADVVYLWLAERDGEYAYLGATSGGMTSELLDLRVPAGMAMTGRIIESGMPLIVSRYFGDPNFVHFPDVDRVMEREKIVATVGVPLVNGSKRLGALIAANRDERAYTPADLDLLHSLAGHAAISIERSRLAEETKTALRSLEDANRELARSNAESERATTAHFTLSQVALAGGNIDNLVQEVVKIVGGELAVFDPDDRLLADAGDLSGTAQPPELIRLAALARTTQTSGSLVAIPILAAARLLGILYYQGDGTPAKPDIQILERAAVVAALLLLLAEAEAGAAGFRRDDFIDDLLSGDEAPSRLIHRAAQLRMELRQPYTVHVVRAPLQQRRLAYLADEAAKIRGGLAGQSHILQRGNKSAVVALIPGNDPRSNSAELSSAIARAGRVTPSVAGAGPTRAVAGVRELFDEAVTCSDAMERIQGGAMSGTLEDLGFVGLVLSNRPNVDRFVRTTLGPVARYDVAHHTELLSTLEALLATDGSPTAASEVLHVHVSTVKQRMQRLKDLLGDDWRTVDRTSELRLALKLHRLNQNTLEAGAQSAPHRGDASAGS